MALDSQDNLGDDDGSDKATLRQYLRQYTYIDYTAENWLDNLLYALPLRAVDHAHCGDQDRAELIPNMSML